MASRCRGTLSEVDLLVEVRSKFTAYVIELSQLIFHYDLTEDLLELDERLARLYL